MNHLITIFSICFLYLFSSLECQTFVSNGDFELTDTDWFKNQPPGWQQERVENFTYWTSGIQQGEDMIHDSWTALLGEPTAVAGGKVEQVDPEEMLRAEILKMESVRQRIDSIVKDKEKILLMDRTFHPFGWAAVAGHLHEGEKPVPAIKREVEEETGLKVSSLKKVRHETVANFPPCSRGVKAHDWVIYEAKAKGKLKKNEEASAMKWFKPEDLPKLKLEPVWEYFFKKLGYLKEQKLKGKK